MLRPRPVTLAMLVAIAVGFRLMPYLLHTLGVPIDPENTVYPWNFSPILPLCIFGAACFAKSDRRLPGAPGNLPGGRPRYMGDYRAPRLGLLCRSAGNVFFRDPGRDLRIHGPLAALLGKDRRSRSGFGSPFLRRFEFRDLGARHDLREDLGRTGGVLRDGGSVFPQHPDQHGRFPAALIQQAGVAQSRARSGRPHRVSAKPRWANSGSFRLSPAPRRS